MTMREKMAKAMEYAALMDKMNEALFVPDAPPTQHYLMLADAALDALMEPTNGMLDAELRVMGGNYNSYCEMIRAAKAGA